MLDRTTIAECLKRHGDNETGDDFTFAVMAELAAIESIVEDRKALQTQRRKLEEEHAAAYIVYEKSLAALQQRCQHWRTEFHSDPSGGSDSFRKCLYCGKYV